MAGFRTRGPQSFPLVAELNEKVGVVLADRRQGRMVRWQTFLKDREGACKQRLGLGGAVSSPVEHGQVVEPAGEVGVLGAERLLVDGDGTLEEWLGRLVAAGDLIERGQLLSEVASPGWSGPWTCSSMARVRLRSSSAAP